MKNHLSLILIILMAIMGFISCKKDEEKDTIVKSQENFVVPSPVTKLFKVELHTLLETVDADQIILTDNGQHDFLDSIKSGDILLSAPNEVAVYGFLRKVTNVHRTGGKIVLTTTKAYLDEAFIGGYVKYKGVLDPSDTIRSLEFKIDSERVVYDHDSDVSTTNDQIKAGGSMAVTLGVEFEFDFSKKTFKVENEASLEGDVHFQWELTSIAGTNLDIEKEVVFRSWKIKPILIQVGIWPIIISPYVDLVAKLDGETKGKANLNVAVSASTKGYVQYDNGWTSGSEGSLEIDPMIGAAVESQMKISLGPQVKFQPYDMDFAEGSIYLFAYGKGDGSAGTSGVDCGIKAGVELGAKTKLDFYKVFENIEFEGTLDFIEKKIWECPEKFTDTRDGKQYPIAQIGTKTWMLTNLDYNAPGSICYNNDSVNCAIFGRLYPWDVALSACPEGWHLPSVEEWKEICEPLTLLPGDYDLFSGSPENLFNNYNFRYEPGGNYNRNLNQFVHWGVQAFYWSSTLHNSSDSTASVALFIPDELSIIGPNGVALPEPRLSYGYSCRCVKD